MISLIPLFFYTLSWIYYSKYQFIERDSSFPVDRSKASRLWHIWKGVNQISFLSLIALFADYKFAVFCASIYWVLFDIGVNIVALNRPWNYYGKTSFIDRMLGKHMIWIKVLVLSVSSYMVFS